jgi:hypothetical protein
VTNGLADGAVVVVHPSDALADGARAEPREGEMPIAEGEASR